MTDDFFGTFEFDSDLGLFCVETTWSGSNITLTLDAKSPDKAERAATVARSLWAAEQSWADRVKNYAAILLHEKCWLDEDSDVDSVTREQFKQRMSIESISVDPDGSFEFWFNDDDMFWGHMIQVWGSVEEGPQDATIVG